MCEANWSVTEYQKIQRILEKHNHLFGGGDKNAGLTLGGRDVAMREGDNTNQFCLVGLHSKMINEVAMYF